MTGTSTSTSTTVASAHRSRLTEFVSYTRAYREGEHRIEFGSILVVCL